MCICNLNMVGFHNKTTWHSDTSVINVFAMKIHQELFPEATVKG